MKKFLIFCFLLQGCSERTVKKMIIEPEPPVPVVSVAECHLHFDGSANIKEVAKQAARISDECQFSDEEFKDLIQSELR